MNTVPDFISYDWQTETITIFGRKYAQEVFEKLPLFNKGERFKVVDNEEHTAIKKLDLLPLEYGYTDDDFIRNTETVRVGGVLVAKIHLSGDDECQIEFFKPFNKFNGHNKAAFLLVHGRDAGEEAIRGAVNAWIDSLYT